MSEPRLLNKGPESIFESVILSIFFAVKPTLTRTTNSCCFSTDLWPRTSGSVGVITTLIKSLGGASDKQMSLFWLQVLKLGRRNDTAASVWRVCRLLALIIASEAHD